MNLISGIGMWQSAKVPSPWHSGLLFLGCILLNSLPSYYEGWQDMKNEPIDENEIRSTSLMRKLGFYCFVGGVSLIALKHRRMIR